MYNVEALVGTHSYHGFPLVDGGLLRGYVARARLREAIGSQDSLSIHFFSLSFYLAPLLEEANNEPAGQCTFIQHPEGFLGADLSSIVDEAPMQMRKEMPLETVTSAFQKMVCVYTFSYPG
jgi:chloride channel 3/4/5